MSCFHPLTAYRVDGSRAYVWRSDTPGIVETVKVPCGRCFGCRQDYASMMAMRCMHEAKMTPGGVANCSFVTLTYDDEHLPEAGSLSVKDCQAFMKALRQHFNPPRRAEESEAEWRKRFVRIRFFLGAEYGELKGRPHYHLLLFGVSFREDRKLCGKGKGGVYRYRSATLERVWGRGSCEVGSVTQASCAYVARYCMKKVTGPGAVEHYRRLNLETGELVQITPEFSLMSRRPGIGATWFAKYGRHCYAIDACIVDGRKVRVPRYYDKLMARTDWLKLQEVKDKRVARAEEHAADNTRARLAVREECAKARMRHLTGSDQR